MGLMIPKAYYFGTTDGSGGSNLNLLNGTDYIVKDIQFTATGVVLTLHVKGTSEADFGTNWQALQDLLTWAEKGTGPFRSGDRTVLSLQLVDTTWRYLDVVRGTLKRTLHYASMADAEVLLTLHCLPFARLDPMNPATSGTLTNGPSSAYLVTDIPGDVPALVRARITDVSTNSKVINAIHLWTRSQRSAAASDFDGILECIPSSPGTAATDSSSYSGTAFARITASEDWQDLATVTKPSAVFETGMYDPILRVRDASDIPGTPTSLTGTVRTMLTLVQSASDTDASVDWPTATTEGNTLILIGASDAVVGSLAASGWTLANDGTDNSEVDAGAGNPCISLWYKANAASESGTVSFTGGGISSEICIMEIRGILPSSLVEDVAADVIGTGSGTGTVNVTNTANRCFNIMCGFRDTLGSGANPGGTGYTDLVQGGRLGVTYRATTASGTFGAAVNWGTSGDYVATHVSFEAVIQSVSLTGSYQMCIVAESGTGGLSVPSNVLTATISSGQEALLSWVAPVSGATVTNYYLYYRLVGATLWSRKSLGSTDTDYTFTSTVGDDLSQSLDASGSGRSEFRLLAATADGTVFWEGDPVLSTYGGSIWHDISMPLSNLPPVSPLDGAVPDDWILKIQARNLESTELVDVDIVYLPKHTEPQCLAYWPGGTLATKRDWVIDLNRDGQVSARLQTAGGTANQGQAYVDQGYPLAEPGDTEFYVRCLIEDFVSDVDDAKYTLDLTITPRCEYREVES